MAITRCPPLPANPCSTTCRSKPKNPKKPHNSGNGGHSGHGGRGGQQAGHARHMHGHYSLVLVPSILSKSSQVCHGRGVVHRDLKPEVFLFGTKKENAPLKAIHFELSIFFEPGDRFYEIVGSPYYMAPEVLNRNHGPEIDIWSADVTLYNLISCGIMFLADTEGGVAQAIIRSVLDFRRDPWPIVSDHANDLLQRTLEPDSKKLLTAQEVHDHHWLRSLINVAGVSLGETVCTRPQHFAVMNKFKNRAHTVIAEHVRIDVVMSIEDSFEKLVVRKEGVIKLDELKDGLHKLGHDITIARVLMDAADVDGNWTWDLGEFVAVSFHIRKIENSEHLCEDSASMDRKVSGSVEVEELSEALANDLGPDHEEILNAIIQDVETDKGGRMCYNESSDMIKGGGRIQGSTPEYGLIP